MLAPDLARDRLALANELIGVASESGHEFLALMGLCWRAVDLFLLGDGRAGRALEDLRERADALMSQNIVYIIEVLDVMRLIRAGRLDEAVAAAERCYELGIEVGEIDTLGYLCAHLLTIRWIQGRDSEVLELANEAATSPTLVRAEFGFKATAAALAARAGDIEPARAALDHLASGGLAALPRSSTWLPGMVAIVEVAAVLRDVAVAEEAYELLRPFSDLPVMPSLAVVCLGSTERALAWPRSPPGTGTGRSLTSNGPSPPIDSCRTDRSWRSPEPSWPRLSTSGARVTTGRAPTSSWNRPSSTPRAWV
jgi:hypothetical protein